MKVFGRPTLKELYELSKDQTITVSRTPFGADLSKGERQIYIKKAVPWKGVKGIENLRKINPAVADTIAKLAEISKKMTRENGFGGTVYVIKNGKLTAMPKKAYIMAKVKDPSIQVVSEYVPAEPLPVEEYVDKMKVIVK